MGENIRSPDGFTRECHEHRPDGRPYDDRVSVEFASLLGGLATPHDDTDSAGSTRWLDATDRWNECAADDLTGRPDEPPMSAPPRVAARVATVGSSLGVEPFGHLTLRARIAGLSRRSPMSCGGSTRLMRAADGWFAVALARRSDIELLSALFDTEIEPPPVAHSEQGDLWPWPIVERLAATLPAEGLVVRGILLGLPIATLGEAEVSAAHPAVNWTPSGEPRAGAAHPFVADLSSLWAGPLCAHLLGKQGFDVMKVESLHRPDGARLGPADFYESLHRGHEERSFDFRSEDGRAALKHCVAKADVVIEASRPRALEQLGIAPHAKQVWLSITGHGRTGRGRERVAFGDDAAVAGGLVVFDDAGPCFLADAIADPLTGLCAALAVQRAWASGQGGVIDIAMARVAAWFAGTA